jgi:RNA polymerase sigma factor (sigma-70 family)
MDSEAIMMIIIMPMFFAITGWAFKIALNSFHNQRLVKLHYALQDKLLEKLGSSPEAIEYLHSDAGEKMFALAAKERTNPYTRILSALQAGAVISLLGIGFIFLRDHFRRAKPVTNEVPERDESPGHAEAVHLRSDVGAAMAELAPRDRQMLWLAYVEGASHREIARVLGLRTASIRSMLFRARQRLAERLRATGLRPDLGVLS